MLNTALSTSRRYGGEVQDTIQYLPSRARIQIGSAVLVPDVRTCPVMDSPDAELTFLDQLEASLRMLSLSATLPPAATTDQDKSEATRGALSQRPYRPRPNSLPPNLPEEETRRIARIFSSQYSQKD
ncbi:hypothetical protein H8959_003033 [Pygathrix nigripes]